MTRTTRSLPIRRALPLALAASVLLAAAPASARDKTATAKDSTASARLLTIRALEQRVQQITARVERSRARMQQVKDKLLDGWNPDTVLELIHANTLGKLFTVKKLRYTLNGRTLTVARGNDRGYHRVFLGKVKPGKHRLKISMIVRGDSLRLSYVSGLHVAVSRTFVFDVQPQTRQVVTARLAEASGLTPRLGRRFDLRIKSEIKPSSVLSSK